MIYDYDTGKVRKISFRRHPVNEKKAQLSRRNFLLTVGAAGAATAAAIVGKNASTTSASDSKDKRATSGYKVSEHINNYYRTAKV